ncbi:Dyp-type peroxidase [Streptomyces sp. NPDC059957]|uniref:Dyp-type peroxidase n=1 Tax=unclassified Streptomyces TaxID=2593676 RepID=UPI00364B9A89
MTTVGTPALELDDIQGGILDPRPSPYVGRYFLLRIDDRRAGRALLRRLIPAISSAAAAPDPDQNVWVNVGLTYEGLRALGVPPESLESFAPEFRQGMAARAELLGDVGDSAPAHWEKPLGTADVHVAVACLSPDATRLDAVLEPALAAFEELSGVEMIFRQDCYQLPTGRTSFGFKDGISNPAVEGGPPGPPSQERPVKAGEFVLGYPDETGNLPPMPYPEVLGRNGTYAVFRKLHTRVAAFRQYLRDHSDGPEAEELLAAKMVGRWPSGAPLVLCPERDDPALGADAQRNNDFLYFDDDERGFKCPAGAHARRMNPRDALKGEVVDVNLHRLIRRGTSYGPMLPDGVLDDDGVDRGIVFIFAGAHLKRQFEFAKTQWANDGIFIGYAEKDPIVGANDETGTFTVPARPVRRRLQELPRFVVTRGGEYCFMPGLRALNWLADLDT